MRLLTANDTCPTSAAFDINMVAIFSRRRTLKSLLLGAAATAAGTNLAAPTEASRHSVSPHEASVVPARWSRGIEGQRRADLGDGTFLNPIFAGDHPDPSILKDGDDYYLTFSSFDAYPGLVIWKSHDLINWTW
jgi:xylan 1,4-beta-xylosidase